MGSPKKRIKPARKKEIANELQQELKLSERRVCRLLSINRTFKRYQSSKLEQDAAITDRLSELATLHRRYGYKRLHILLRREGFKINHKKTYRLYIEAGLCIRKRKKKCPSEKRGSRIQLKLLMLGGRLFLCLTPLQTDANFAFSR